MFSRARLSRTSLKPQAPRPIEPSPTAMRMTLAAMPPYSKSFRFMATPFALLFMPAWCPAGLGATSGQGRRLGAVFHGGLKTLARRGLSHAHHLCRHLGGARRHTMVRLFLARRRPTSPLCHHPPLVHD